MSAAPKIEPQTTALTADADDRHVDVFGGQAQTYAQHYSGIDTPVAYFFHRRQALVMNALRNLAGGAILDVGCGPGVYARACLDRGFRYDGLDASAGMIEEGSKRLCARDGAKLTVGDARRLPYPANSFDAALCLGMLEYVTKEDEALCLQELTRVVKPGGLIVFSFLNATSPYWVWVDRCYPLLKFVGKNIAAMVGRAKWTRLRDCSYEPEPFRRFKLGERVQTLRRQRFSIEGAKYFCLSLFPPPFDRVIVAPSIWVSAMLEPLLSARWLGWLGMAFLVFARKPAEDATEALAAAAAA
ncbi:MAG: class I SAM-dependent methyltransferase [Vitreimonas sp.]